MLANTFTPPKLDSLIQPASTRLIPIPHVNGGSFQSLTMGEGPGPIRSHTRQAARERPSPVAYDGNLTLSLLNIDDRQFQRDHNDIVSCENFYRISIRIYTLQKNFQKKFFPTGG